MIRLYFKEARKERGACGLTTKTDFDYRLVSQPELMKILYPYYSAHNLLLLPFLYITCTTILFRHFCNRLGNSSTRKYIL